MTRTIRLAVLGIALAATLTACTDTPPPPPYRPTPTPASTTAAPSEVGSGQHFVGVPIPEGSAWDPSYTTIEPGAYEATADVAGPVSDPLRGSADGRPCYWHVYRAEDFGGDFAGRATGYGQPTSGRPRVTLRAGDWWQVWDCGTWRKVG